jgi:hypothetical protein
MLNKLLFSLITLLACMACTQACNITVLEQNFDKYSGGYRLWDKNMAKADMPGFLFLKASTAGNSMVGEGQYRSTNPKGNSLSCSARHCEARITDVCVLQHKHS